MNSSRRTSIVFVVGLAVLMLGLTLGFGWHPRLGLDLQGGTQVVLKATNKVDSGTLSQAKEIIERRVNGLGVAEPEVQVQGDRIVVQLPGLKDFDQARAVVGQTAELRFRPVLGILKPKTQASSTTSSSGAEVTGSSASTVTSTTVAGSEGALGAGAGIRGFRKSPASGASSTSGFTNGSSITGDSEGNVTVTSTGDVVINTPTTSTTAFVEPSNALGITPDEEDIADQQVVLLGSDGRRYVLGPTVVTGDVISDAQAAVDQSSGGWQILFEVKSSEADNFQSITSQYVGRQLAIVLDHQVESAPTINEPLRDRAQITGRFGEKEARNLALVLRYGSLPAELKEDTVQNVSATLGKDSLHAGVIAGIFGLLLVIMYMVFFYRALGFVALAGLLLSAALMWSIVSMLGEAWGLALTLAGAVGLIVSVGVTIDSYIVFFERVRDEIRHGSSPRTAVDKGFKRAWRTILAADTVSFIGAFVLYTLTVGSVRGFAFFLGLSTILDVFVAWFFTRPVVQSLGRNKGFVYKNWSGFLIDAEVEAQ